MDIRAVPAFLQDGSESVADDRYLGQPERWWRGGTTIGRVARKHLDISVLAIAAAQLFFGRPRNTLAQIIDVHDRYNLDCGVQF
jgi:hypothetical protein